MRAAPTLACLVLLGCAPKPAPSEPAAPNITLSIVSTNDVHGRITQLPLLGGYVDNLRAQRAASGGALLLLDAGDIFQGTLESNATEGASMVRAYNALGYDAVTLGNHEFDFGPVGPAPTPAAPGDDPLGALKARIAEAAFPFLNANLQHQDGTPLDVPKLRASVMLHPAGVPVGIVGGVTEDTLRTTHADNMRGIALEPLPRAIGTEAAKLRAQGARVVIALVHAGGECPSLTDLHGCAEGSEAFRLARELPKGSVDVIVAGHTHQGLAHTVNGVAIIEAYSNGRAFARADVTLQPGGAPQLEIFPPTQLCSDALDKPSCAEGLSYANKPVLRSERVVAAIREDVTRGRATSERSLGVNVASELWREYRSESPTNNLVADMILRAAPGADAAFSNAGAIRAALPAGLLRFGAIYEMFPFDNTVAMIGMRAEQLAAIVEKNLRANNGLLSLAGVRAAASCRDQELRVQLYAASGKVIDPKRKLRVATSDFLARSGDGLLVGMQLEEGAISVARDKLVRDALIAGLQAYPGATVSPDDKRLFDRDKPRIAYPGSRPVTCR
jgi:2',3'-cyclic-nucleotide 2'-phosphodiesterase (5'-nucleotidase family)